MPLVLTNFKRARFPLNHCRDHFTTLDILLCREHTHAHTRARARCDACVMLLLGLPEASIACLLLLPMMFSVCLFCVAGFFCCFGFWVDSHIHLLIVSRQCQPVADKLRTLHQMLGTKPCSDCYSFYTAVPPDCLAQPHEIWCRVLTLHRTYLVTICPLVFR